MGREQLIPDEDFHLIEELAQTLEAREIAEKWEVTAFTLRKYLQRFGTSFLVIRTDYRMKIYREEAAKGKSKKDIAELIGIAPDNLRKMVRRVKKAQSEIKYI